jgi:predicted GH43/DUF377 family glycosyl hydrolase
MKDRKIPLLVIVIITLTAVYQAALGMEWVKHDDNPVLHKSGDEWDSGTIHAASVIREGDLYRMWYSASGAQGNGIGTAQSSDRINWEKYPHNPLITPGPEDYDNSSFFAPMVIRDGDHYKMWYTAVNQSYVWSIALATSPDGYDWTKHPGNPVLIPGTEWYDRERVSGPSILLEDGMFKMWFTCQNRPQIGYGIGYATSIDGIDWVKHPDPVLLAEGDGPDNGSVRSPSVVKGKDGYEMWYRGIGKGGHWTVCYATSKDGINWERYAENPVLTGKPGGWDNRIWFPRVLLEEDRYSMWYASADEDEIGYAFLPISQCFIAGAAGVIGIVLAKKSS